jgi:hypothetical protein
LATSPGEPSVTIAASAKNEGRFLLEWIAYHRLIGVTSFLIYTNDCEDDSPALLDRLGELGIVTHVPNPVEPGEQPQPKAMARARQHTLVKNAEYLLPIDLDEFLVVKAGANRIADLLGTAPGADGVCVQMRYFGNSGLDRLPRGLVTENFTKCSKESFVKNGMIKTLVKNTPRFSDTLRNHLPRIAEGAAVKFFNAGGVELPASFGTKGRWLIKPYQSMKHAQLNHYAVKTFDYYRAKKARGDAKENRGKFNMTYWKLLNRNEREDKTILAHVPAVKALVAEWLRDAELSRCNDRCFEAYGAILRRAEEIVIESAPSGAKPRRLVNRGGAT